MITLNCFLIILYIITVSQVACRVCQPHTYLQKNNKCCREVYCQDDTYVDACIEDNGRDICRPCQRGYTLVYGSSSFNPRQCYPKPVNMPQQDEVVAVNATNFECNRTIGFIQKPSESRIQLGLNCQERNAPCGRGKEPLAVLDCRQCPDGFFKSDNSDYGMCRAWRNCSMLGLVESMSGSHIRDVTCTEVSESTTTAGPTLPTGPSTKPSTGPSTRSPTSHPTVPPSVQSTDSTTTPPATTEAPRPGEVPPWVVPTISCVAVALTLIVLIYFLWKKCLPLRCCVHRGNETDVHQRMEMEPLRLDSLNGSPSIQTSGYPSNITQCTYVTEPTLPQFESSSVPPDHLTVTDSSSWTPQTNGSASPVTDKQFENVSSGHRDAVQGSDSDTSSYPSGQSSLTGLKQVQETTQHVTDRKEVAPMVEETRRKQAGAEGVAPRADARADANKQTVPKVAFNDAGSPGRGQGVPVNPRPALTLITRPSTEKKRPVGVVTPMVTPGQDSPFQFPRTPDENSDNSSSNVSQFHSPTRNNPPPLQRGNSSGGTTQQAVVSPLVNTQPDRAVDPADEMLREAAPRRSR